MSRLERRIALRSSDKDASDKSLQELQKLSDDQKALEGIQRRPGEGLTEYVERVTGGAYVLLDRGYYRNLLVERDRLEAEVRRRSQDRSPASVPHNPEPRERTRRILVGGPSHARIVNLDATVRGITIGSMPPLSAIDLRATTAIRRHDAGVLSVHQYLQLPNRRGLMRYGAPEPLFFSTLIDNAEMTSVQMRNLDDLYLDALHTSGESTFLGVISYG